MKKIVYIFIVLIICIFLSRCKKEIDINENKTSGPTIENKENDGSENINMNDYDIFDFYLIKKAPESKRKQNLDKVIKIAFDENDSSLSNTIAIDLANNEIYINPRWSSHGIRSREGTIKSNDVKNVLEILEKYNVQKWKSDYTVEEPESYVDGYGWSLWLQFEDGTVKTYLGRGDKEDVVPKNFDEFVNELSKFVNERIGDN